MAIVAGFDVHRAQITFDALDIETGEVMRGRIDATPAAVARWVERFDGQEIDVAVEACTGWLFVCDALMAAGAVAHLAEPVETRALRGRKRRAKTDREDARWLRELLGDGRLPEAWIPPEHVRQWRSRAHAPTRFHGHRPTFFKWAICFAPPIPAGCRRSRSGGLAGCDERRVGVWVGGERALDEPVEEQAAMA